MKKIFYGIAAVWCGTILSGCLGPTVDYTGKTAPAGAEPIFLGSAEEISSWEILGECTVSGGYQRFSFEDLRRSLLEQAKKAGADALFVTRETVIPAGTEREDQALNITPLQRDRIVDNSESNHWVMDSEIISAERAFSPPVAVEVPVYRRKVRAVFLKRK